MIYNVEFTNEERRVLKNLLDSNKELYSPALADLGVEAYMNGLADGMLVTAGVALATYLLVKVYKGCKKHKKELES